MTRGQTMKTIAIIDDDVPIGDILCITLRLPE